MSQKILDAIDELKAQIAAKEAEHITPLKLAINSLCGAIGQPAFYSMDGSGSSTKKMGLEWKIDEFFGRPLATCVSIYLEKRKSVGMEGPATIDEIYDTLRQGGYKFEGATGSDENNKRALKISLTKNTAQFSKISEDVFGLKKWYQGGTRAPRKARPAGEAPADDDAIIEDTAGETEEAPASS